MVAGGILALSVSFSTGQMVTIGQDQMKSEVLHNFWGTLGYSGVSLCNYGVTKPGGTLGMERQSQAGEPSGLAFACCVTLGKQPRCPVYPDASLARGLWRKGSRGNVDRHLSLDR